MKINPEIKAKQKIMNDPNKPCTGDIYFHTRGKLVVAGIERYPYYGILIHKVTYFMNGDKHDCSYLEFPHLISSLYLEIQNHD